MRHDLPTGTVTFLFTDVEGSTRLLHELGAEEYAKALAEHRRVVRDACVSEGGVEVDTQGDAFFFAFPTAPGALAAASTFTEMLASGSVQVRVGIHTGTPLLAEEGYVGDDVHFAARVGSSGHGGQVVVSPATAAALTPSDTVSQGLALIDLGEHRLKDIPKAVPLYQLGEGSFPPLKTISNTNLPRPASSFLGRESEVTDVVSRLESARLVTLTGPGGTGKTRLAIEAASSVVTHYKAGVFWVGLASLRDPALVTETIAQTLGATDNLAAHIAEREMLLLLDNLEQVIDSAPDLSQLLESCPNLTLLVTSRELLRVRGEVEYPVPPLAAAEAIDLFCMRSQIEPSEEITELCARLDSLPLAVELAAARTKALTPAQILERVSQRLDLLKGGRDADPRQQTLRATIEWSYELLIPEEQELFARLSVFAGGCTLDAAEEVCDADLDTLQSLVEKSLLRFTPHEAGGRYWMLETIREYAGELLADEDTKQRFVDYFAALPSALETDGGSVTANVAGMERLELEGANLRIALEHLLGEGDGGEALEMVAALSPYWLVRGPFQEALTWIEGALAHDRSTQPALRGKALSAAADLCWSLGDLERARVYATENVALSERVGEPRAIAQALHDLAEVVTEEADFEQAKTLYEEAIRRAREVGYPAPGSIGNLSLIAFAERDYVRARRLAVQATDIFRERNNPLGLASGLVSVSCASLYCGDVGEACSALRESIGISADGRYEVLVASCLRAGAAILARAKHPREAASLLGASERVLEDMHSSLEATELEMHQETQELIRTALNDRERTLAWESGRTLTLDDAVALALASLD